MPDRLPPTPVEERGRDFHRLTLAACRDEQTTLEGADRGTGGGVATTAMFDAVRHLPEVSYDGLWQYVAQQVQKALPPWQRQQPHLTSSGPDDSLVRSPAFVAS